ncbi:MAG TPA: hypothetical protein PLN63_03665 [Paludibacteraceae bacterium]|nr:hypothetical protein [Paludibacteraceae bacterium]HOU69701.1 hypothetical protein [Paludibacteraceae bacterium]HPH62702.1 hypothetical protein [Paludibacteraceae bacterium]
MKTRLTIILVLLALVSMAGAQTRLPYVFGNGLNGDGCDTIYTLPNKKAEFPGGMNAMYEFFTDNLKENVNFISSMSAHRMLLKIRVGANGEVLESKIMMPSATALDEDVLRVVSMFPDMIPAKFEGRDVCSYLIIPLGYE